MYCPNGFTFLTVSNTGAFVFVRFCCDLSCFAPSYSIFLRPVAACPAPLCPAPLCPAPLCPAPSCPALPCPALPCPALPCPALPCPALPCAALPCAALSCPVLPRPALPCPVLSCSVLYCRVLLLSCFVLSCPVLSCPVLSCPVLSCPVLSCPVLPCPVLSCPVLSCPLAFIVIILSLRTIATTYHVATQSIEQHDSTYWPAYSLRGRLKYLHGDIPGALSDLTVCVEEAPQDRAALKTRARCDIDAAPLRLKNCLLNDGAP